MTKAIFYRSKLFKRVEITGHSGYAEAGSDIVCAAVSSMLNLTMAIFDKSKAQYKAGELGDAQAFVEVTPTKFTDDVISALHDEIKALSLQYPQFVSVEVINFVKE